MVSNLGGNPLLIELAAARFEALGADELASRLTEPLEALSGTRAADYAFTLEEALSYWWRSLDAVERRALGCCALFEGPFTLASAERIVESIGAPAVATLTALRDKSLLVRSSASASRFTLTSHVRAFVRRGSRSRRTVLAISMRRSHDSSSRAAKRWRRNSAWGTERPDEARRVDERTSSPCQTEPSSYERMVTWRFARSSPPIP